MKLYIVFDDTNRKSEVIRDVIGENGFADVVVKKKRLETYYLEHMRQIYPDAVCHVVRSAFEFSELAKYLERSVSEDTKVLHYFSNFLISDGEKAGLALKKINYIDEDYTVFSGKKAAGAMFRNIASYLKFLNRIGGGETSVKAVRMIEKHFAVEGLVDIGEVENFIQCITGNFDSRFFNNLQGDEYTLVKSSTDRKKIKSEYQYYHLLPEDMKMWCVMPFHYEENGEAASYRMERLHMTDIAIKWVHGSIDLEEFGQIMDKYFYFFRCRHSREVPHDEFQKTADGLFVKKVTERITLLKEHDGYEKIRKLIDAGCREKSIDDIVQKYFTLKDKIEAGNDYPSRSVIGHGDPCFANALYNKTTKTLKFIDPKGALTEEELWTNPYYDIAKLSHSVCGCYDFFNNSLFDIRINENFECELEIDFDNAKYKELFRQKLEENGYDYLSVRIYEVSLFLSMLPLHMDYPHKVFGFILNAVNILKEIERDV